MEASMVIPVIEEQIVVDRHLAENGYECENPDCICHWERRTQEQDYETGTHAPDCRCFWCEPQN